MIIHFCDTGGIILNQPKEKPIELNLPKESDYEPDILTPKGQCQEIRIKGRLSDI